MNTVIEATITHRQMLTANQRLHWRARAARTATLRNLGVILTRQAKAAPMTRAHCTVTVTFPDRRRRDVANWAPTVKALVDGCVQAGLLPDDDTAHLLGPDLRVADDVTGRPRTYTFRLNFEDLPPNPRKDLP